MLMISAVHGCGWFTWPDARMPSTVMILDEHHEEMHVWSGVVTVDGKEHHYEYLLGDSMYDAFPLYSERRDLIQRTLREYGVIPQ